MTNSKDQARVNLSPSIQAARTAIAIANPQLKPMGSQELLDHVEEIESAIARLQRNDLSDLERSLMTQITVLQSQFFHWSQAAAKLTAVDFPASERAFGMAMRSQKQLLKTIAVLHEMKRPRKSATFVKKQQNNLLYQGQPPQEQPNVQQRHVRSQDVEVRSQLNPSTSQEFRHAQMDARSQSEAIPVDSPVATVGGQQRTKD